MPKLIFFKSGSTATAPVRSKALAAGKKASSKYAGKKKPSLEKVTFSKGGKRHVLYALDANSDKFGEALAAVFSKSVKKARRENSRVTGKPDLAARRP